MTIYANFAQKKNQKSCFRHDLFLYIFNKKKHPKFSRIEQKIIKNRDKHCQKWQEKSHQLSINFDNI